MRTSIFFGIFLSVALPGAVLAQDGASTGPVQAVQRIASQRASAAHARAQALQPASSTVRFGTRAPALRPVVVLPAASRDVPVARAQARASQPADGDLGLRAKLGRAAAARAQVKAGKAEAKQRPAGAARQPEPGSEAARSRSSDARPAGAEDTRGPAPQPAPRR